MLVGNVIYGGHGSNNGLPTCVDLRTGRILWKRRGPGIGSAAVVYADGHLYLRYQNGVMALVKANAEGYQLKGTFNIPGAGGDSWSHPVVTGGRLYLREKDVLLVYDVRKHAGVAVTDNAASSAVSVDRVMTALKQMFVRVDPIKVDVPDNTRYERVRLHDLFRVERHAHVTYAVTLDDRHITPDGLITKRVLALLKQLRDFHELRLSGTRFSDQGLSQLPRLDTVEVLNLELCNALTDDGLIHLQELSNLRVLILAGTAVGDAGLRHVGSLRHLAGLDLEFCENVTDVGLNHLDSLANLRWLALKRTGFGPNPITDTGLSYLRSLTKLSLLDLYGNKITDTGLIHLTKMNRLEHLDLSLTHVTDSGLRHLRSLKNLERLELIFTEGFAGPKISDEGLRHIGSLENLKSLCLIGANVSDVGLEQIAVLTELRLLNLVDTGITSAAANSLQQRLPNCKIKR